MPPSTVKPVKREKRVRDTKTNCYTQLKLSRDVHRVAKAAALMIDEEFYEFVEKSVKLRIESLKEEGKLNI